MSSQPFDVNAELARIRAEFAGLNAARPACVKAALSKDAVVVPQPDGNGEFAYPADGAKFMAALGIPQTPLKGKNPSIGGTDWHLRASTDFAQIDEWARIHPGCNFGSVAFAEIGKHFVLEIDSPEVRKRHQVDTNTEFSKTLTIQSREGRGHRWYLQTKESIALGNISQDNRFGDFSLRMQHEQAVSPGSIHPDTGEQYRVVVKASPTVMPPADIKWLGTQKKFRVKVDKSLMGAKIPYGQHDVTLFKIACSLRHDGLEEQGIYACLVEVCQKRCEGYGDDYLEMCAKKAARACTYPPGTDEKIIFSAYGVSPAQVASPSNTDAPAGLVFRRPAVEFKFPRDYAIAPAQGQKCGWFPAGGAPSILAGPSAAGKTTWLYQLLTTQIYKRQFHGHDTYGFSYLTLGRDRGNADHLETMERMHLSPELVPFIPISSSVYDFEAAQEILKHIEDTVPTPKIVFIEGVDMLVTRGNELPNTTEFMHLLQQISEHYNLVIIGSAGSPKIKEGNGYTLTRDNILGSTGWGRAASTIAMLQFSKKNEKGRRVLTVELRNAPPEKFVLAFVDGQLEVQPDDPDEEEARNDSPQLYQYLDWYQEQARLAEKEPTKKWWTAMDVEAALCLAHSTAERNVKQHYTKDYLIKKTGGKQGTRGQATQYRWNEKDSNPEVKKQQQQCDQDGPEILIEP